MEGGSAGSGGQSRSTSSSPNQSFLQKSGRFPKTIASVSVGIGLVIATLLMTGGFMVGKAHTENHRGGHSFPPSFLGNQSSLPSHRVPTNINLGGWLALEDWFYSGPSGRYVASPLDVGVGQGNCLPPLLKGPFHWDSEGLLVKKLIDVNGTAAAIDVMTQHRKTYITNDDLDDMAALGVQMIRVPMTWSAFADALAPIDKDSYGSFDPEVDETVVPDPYYSTEVFQVTINRQRLRNFLTEVGLRGMRVLLDIHNMPGGSSRGTYNGIWPSKPMFWEANCTLGSNLPLKEAGHLIVGKLLEFVEGLPANARRGVGGVTLMNEPGHLLAGKVNPDEVLAWVAKAADMFRSTTLPNQGVKLYVNLIETLFENSTFDAKVGPWLNKTFTEEERNIWAILDIHHYLAWTESCQGAPEKMEGGGYNCSDAPDKVRKVLKGCVEPWAQHFAKTYPGLRSSSEFSLGTNQDAWAACTEPEVIRNFFQQQITSMQDASIEPFFWTWRMPYGPRFEAGWSFKRFCGLEQDPPVEDCRAGSTPAANPETSVAH